jgi:hypothetical protein
MNMKQMRGTIPSRGLGQKRIQVLPAAPSAPSLTLPSPKLPSVAAEPAMQATKRAKMQTQAFGRMRGVRSTTKNGMY